MPPPSSRRLLFARAALLSVALSLGSVRAWSAGSLADLPSKSQTRARTPDPVQVSRALKTQFSVLAGWRDLIITPQVAKEMADGMLAHAKTDDERFAAAALGKALAQPQENLSRLQALVGASNVPESGTLLSELNFWTQKFNGSPEARAPMAATLAQEPEVAKFQAVWDEYVAAGGAAAAPAVRARQGSAAVSSHLPPHTPKVPERHLEEIAGPIGGPSRDLLETDAEVRQAIDALRLPAAANANATGIGYLPEQGLIAIVYRDGSVKFFDFKTKSYRDFPGVKPGSVRSSLSSDGKSLFVQYKDGASVHDLATGASTDIPNGNNISWTMFTDDGRALFVRYKDNAARAYDWRAQRDLGLSIKQDVPFSKAYFKGNRLLIVVYDDKERSIAAFDAKTGNDVTSLARWEPKSSKLLAEDGNWVWLHNTKSDRFLDLDAGVDHGKQVGNDGSVADASYSQGHLLIRYADKRVKLFDVRAGKEVTSWDPKEVLDAFFVEGGKSIFVQTKNGPGKTRSLENGAEAVLPDSPVRPADVYHGDRHVLVKYKDKSVRLFDLRRGEEVGLALGGPIKGAKFSPSGRYLFARFDDKEGTAKLFDLEKRTDTGLAIGPRASSIQFSPSEKLAVVSYQEYGMNDAYKVFKLGTGEDLGIPSVAGAQAKEFSADEKLLLVSSPRSGRRAFDLESPIGSVPALKKALQLWTESAGFGVDLLARALAKNPAPSTEEFKGWYSFLLGPVKDINALTTSHNRGVLMGLFDASGVLDTLQKRDADLRTHLLFYVDLIRRTRRGAVQVLEGVMEGINHSWISMALPVGERARIADFVQKTRGFNLNLYQMYLKEGPASLSEVEPFSRKMLRDEVGLEDMSRFEQDMGRRGYAGDEMLMAVLQETIPTTGLSQFRKNEIKDVLKKVREVGDRRADVPPALRALGEFGGREFRVKSWELKAGERFDPDNKVEGLLSRLGRAGGEAEADRQGLAAALRDYLGEKNPAKEAAALAAFLDYARHDDAVKRELANIPKQSDHAYLSVVGHGSREELNRQFARRQAFASLESLGRLFGEKGALNGLLNGVIGRELKPEGTQPIRDEKKLLKSLAAVWSAEGAADAKRAKLAGLLAAARSDEIKSKLLAQDADAGLKKEIEGILAARSGLSAAELIGELLRPPRELLSAERSKFEPVESVRTIRFRVVKGPAYGLNGFCSGVCTARNVDLWKKKEFYLLAMIDEADGKAVGFAHLFEAEVDGKRYLTVPGINPSEDLQREVSAAEVYPAIEEALKTVGAAGAFDEVGIPTAKHIPSNRGDVDKMIRSRGYAPKKFSRKVEWSLSPNYPFDEIYVVWKKPEAASAAPAPQP